MPAPAVLLSPGPDTETDVALPVFHATVVVPGSVPVVGLAVIAPETEGADVTVNVVVCVTGQSGPCAVIV